MIWAGRRYHLAGDMNPPEVMPSSFGGKSKGVFGMFLY